MKKKTPPKTKNIRIAKDKSGKKTAPPKKEADKVWAHLMKIGEKISKGWESEQSAVEILSEIRR